MTSENMLKYSINCSENATELICADASSTDNGSGVVNNIMSAIEFIQSIAVLVGLVGNTINLVVLVRICRNLRVRKVYDNSAMVMLIWMSSVDLLTLALQLPFVLHDWEIADFCLTEANAYYECYVWYPFSQSGVTAIALMSVIISLDRFAAVRGLHTIQNAFRKRTSLIMACAICVAMLFHMPRYFEKYVKKVDHFPAENMTAFTCEQTAFHDTHAAQLTILTVTVNAVIPMFVVLVLGAGVVHKLIVVEKYHESLGSKNMQSDAKISLATKLVVANVVVFSIWALFVAVTAVVMQVQGADKFFKSEMGFLIGKLSSMIAYVKSSISFILYCGTCAEYRASFRQLATCQDSKILARPASSEKKRFISNDKTRVDVPTRIDS